MLGDDQATTKEVAKALPTHAWARTSPATATADLADPSQGGLQLPGGLLAVGDLSGHDLRHSELAVLFACQTAAGSISNPDEAINLATVMHYAGYRHVVGTIWSIPNSYAARLAYRFYKKIFQDGALKTDMSARALHAAVRELRQRLPESDVHGITAWMPFIHLGP